jgi:hypothetical protein
MTVSPPKLYAIVQRGQNRGARVTPHKYVDGKYHVARKKEATDRARPRCITLCQWAVSNVSLAN